MTRKLSGGLFGGAGAVAIAALQHQQSSASTKCQVSASAADSVRDDGVTAALLGTVEEGSVWPTDLAMTATAKRGFSDSLLMRGSASRGGGDGVGGGSSGSGSSQLSHNQRMKLGEGWTEAAARSPSSSGVGAGVAGVSQSCISFPALASSVSAEGFATLVRRRTFTSVDEKLLSSGDRSKDDIKIDRNGHHPNVHLTTAHMTARMPMTASQDNILTLFKERKSTPTAFGVSRSYSEAGAEEAIASVSNTSSAAMDEAALSLAGRNILVLRLHKAGILEDACRCVMDLVEGRMVGSGGSAGSVGAPGTGATGRVTKEEVRAHFNSFPQRYSLTVEPPDVLVHMRLMAEASEPSARPAVVVTRASPTGPPSIDGGACGDGRVWRAIVACRGCPSLLSVIASSVRCAGGTPIDTDVMTTTDGMSLARLEVQGNWTIPFPSSSAAESAPQHPLAGALSSGIARALAVDDAKLNESRMRGVDDARSSLSCDDDANVRMGDGGDLGVGRSDESMEYDHGSHGNERRINYDLQAPAKKARASRSPTSFAEQMGGHRHGNDKTCSTEEYFTLHSGLAGKTSPPPCSGDPPFGLAKEVTGSHSSAPQDLPPERKGEGERMKSYAPPTANSNNGRRQAGHHGAVSEDRSGIDTTVEAPPPAHDQQPASNASAEGVTSSTSAAEAGMAGRTRRRRGHLVRRSGCQFPASANGGSSLPMKTAAPPAAGGGIEAGSPERNVACTQYACSSDSVIFDDYIAADEIEVLELVGNGRFSRTHRARWRGKIVAVKTVELPGKPSTVAQGVVKGSGLMATGSGGGHETGGETWEVELAPHSEGRLIMTEFERELHIVRRLKHPNICAYMGVCIAAPWFSLVYEYLEHGSLSERLRRVPGAGLPTTKRRSSPSSSESDGGKGDGGENGRRNLLPLGTAALLGIGEDVAEGMRYLHQTSVLHRDLKSANILLDANDRARIADFGLSCFCNPMREHTAETGTYRWMAPEVIRHEPYSKAADVYSFGVVLWEVLTSKQPFEDLTPIQAAFAVARQGLRPQLPHDAPPALAALIRSCWHQTSDARPSFAQICAELPKVKAEALSLKAKGSGEDVGHASGFSGGSHDGGDTGGRGQSCFGLPQSRS